MRGSCTICTELFTSDKEISAVPCGHTFHDGCLSQWLRQSKSCPQCRKGVNAKNVIHKLYFAEADDETDEVDTARLKNDLDTVKVTLREKEREKSQLREEQETLQKRISGLEDTVNSLQSLYRQEKSKTDTLRKELGYMKKVQSDASSAKEEANKLREKLVDLRNVQDLVNGMIPDIEEKARNATVKDLAQWCVIQERELRRKRNDCKKLQEDSQTKGRELMRTKKLLDEKTRELVVIEEKLKIGEQDVNSLEKENISLKKKLEALQKSLGSPSELGASLAHRLINESPAPMPPQKRPRLSLPDEMCDDLDVTSEILATSPTSPLTQEPSAAKIKNNIKEFGTKFVKITSAASSTVPHSKGVKDISNLPGLGNLNILRHTMNTTSMMAREKTSIKKGYNGLGGHEKFIRPQGRPFVSKNKMKKASSTSSVLGKSSLSNPPPLPSLGSFLK